MTSDQAVQIINLLTDIKALMLTTIAITVTVILIMKLIKLIKEH